MTPRTRGTLLVLAAAVMWGTFGLLAKKLYGYGYTAMELASLRTAIGLLALGLFLLARRHSVRIPARVVPFYLGYGLIGFALFEYLYFAALEQLGIGVASALLYTAPAFVLLYALARGEERWSAGRGIILLLVLAGATLVTGALDNLRTGNSAISRTGLLLGLSAGVTYASYTIFSKRGIQKHDALTNLFWVLLIATIAFAVPAPPWRVFRAAESLPWLIALGVGPTVLAYLCYLEGLKRLSASSASMLATIEPAVAAVLGVALLNESLGVARAVGIGLILAAAVGVSRLRTTEESEQATAGN